MAENTSYEQIFSGNLFEAGFQCGKETISPNLEKRLDAKPGLKEIYERILGCFSDLLKYETEQGTKYNFSGAYVKVEIK